MQYCVSLCVCHGCRHVDEEPDVEDVASHESDGRMKMIEGELGESEDPVQPSEPDDDAKKTLHWFRI